MRETNNSLKGIFTIRNNGMIKKLLINEKSADLINLSDIYCNLDDVNFYKNNKSYFNKYSLINKKKRRDFKKNHRRLSCYSHKN